MKKYFILILSILGISIAIKVFIFSVYIVSSVSMEPTLLIGDRILTKKILLSEDDEKKKLKHDDIMVFRPTDTLFAHQKYIKRCIGLPGDTIEIVRGQLIRNNIYLEKLNEIYRIEQKDISNESDYRVSFLKNMIFPENNMINYTILNFGPLIIPKKGMKISLTHENKILYWCVIPQYTGNYTNVNSSGLSQNHVYCVEKDYYFVMGDNYFNSEDSRYWGFLPEENIIGKTTRILYSKGSRGFRWDRVFRRIQ